MSSIGYRLEQYTLKHPQEVLLVTADIAGERDEMALLHERGVAGRRGMVNFSYHRRCCMKEGLRAGEAW
ncbi:MAG: hypothetical protein IGR76_01605 [Synechococcales cyanobacterium T60_A2020_003]|nr:hypothetical protein [Synechococcales cyanobacterium T60_A2020_003]